MRLRRSHFLCFVLTLALATPAMAAHKKTVRAELPAAARANWDNANTLSGQQDWLRARDEFLRAYEISKNPRVLLNVAVCEKNLHHYHKAAEYLRRELGEGAGTLPKDEVEAAKGALSALDALVTTLEITVSEPGAEVRVDDDVVGTSPLDGPVPIDTGPHTVKITKAGFLPARRKIDAVSNRPEHLTVKLDPAVRTAHVTVSVTGPAHAVVLLDGRDVGNAPFDADVQEGPHVFEARADDWVTGRREVKVVYHTPLSLEIALSRRRHEGILHVTTHPVGALIELDGKTVGESTWEGPVASDSSHQLVVKKDGYYTRILEVTVGDDKRRDMPVSLDTAKTWIWWAAGAVAIVAGGIVASAFIFAAPGHDPVPGTLAAGRGWGLTNVHF